MPAETLSAVEMNAIDRQILDAERGRRDRVELDARTARMLYEEAVGSRTEAAETIDRLNHKIDEMEDEMGEAA